MPDKKGRVKFRLVDDFEHAQGISAANFAKVTRYHYGKFN